LTVDPAVRAERRDLSPVLLYPCSEPADVDAVVRPSGQNRPTELHQDGVFVLQAMERGKGSGSSAEAFDRQGRHTGNATVAVADPS
jgi:hypothetical protein